MIMGERKISSQNKSQEVKDYYKNSPLELLIINPYKNNTLLQTNIAMENPPFWWYLLGKMGIFMGYVSFREGSLYRKTIQWIVFRLPGKYSNKITLPHHYLNTPRLKVLNIRCKENVFPFSNKLPIFHHLKQISQTHQAIYCTFSCTLLKLGFTASDMLVTSCLKIT